MALHGFPESSACWAPVGTALAERGLTVHAADQRGYSPEARPDGIDAYRMSELVADAVALIDHVSPTAPVLLVGHDWGAAVAWTVAARHPDRVSALTALSVPHPTAFRRARVEDPQQRERSGYMEFFARPEEPERALLADDALALRLGFGDVVPADIVADHLAVLSAPGAMTAALNWYRAEALDTEEVPAVTVPTTFVWSTDDIAIAEYGPRLTVEYVDAPYEFIELSGVTHWIPEQAPEAVVDAVISTAAPLSPDLTSGGA
nr:alpha/beta fold hydrolase [Gordonia soli]